MCYSVKRHSAFSICEVNKSYHQLKHGKKTSYIGHPRFLKPNHPYRRLKKAFNGSQENKIAPPPLTGKEVYNRVCNVNVNFGKTQEKHCEKHKKEEIHIL